MRELRFRGDGRFLIAQITDAHFCDGSEADGRTHALIERVLDAERPDLVALTGDFVDGSRARDPAGAWLDGVRAIEARGVPWAAVFGNHDDEGSASRRDLLQAQQTSPLCLTEAGPESLTGVGNYVLEVGGSAGARAAARLYFLDSGSYARSGAGIYAWIAHDQIAWYREVSRQPAAPLPALAFFHIPLPEYQAAYEAGDVAGSRNEDVCCPALNSGLFTAFHERGDVIGAFCGHDHLNDFEAGYHGIRLCYGRASGYNSYGSDDFPRGVRLIELREGERAFRTWLRLDTDAGLVRREQTSLTEPPPESLDDA